MTPDRAPPIVHGHPPPRRPRGAWHAVRAVRAVSALHAVGLALALLAAALPARAGKAHEHGAARLDVAVDGAQLTLALEMPLDSVVGYERAPRTEAERQAAAAALARLRGGAALFRTDAAAGCTLASAQVTAPVLEPAAGAAKPPADGHADLEANYVFQCAQPARLAAVEVLLFDAFKRLERIEVQAVLAKGQRKAVLRRTARVVRLGG